MKFKNTICRLFAEGNKLNLLCQLLFSASFLILIGTHSLWAQAPMITVDAQDIANHWFDLESNVKYKIGDQLQWSDPSFDDTQWTLFNAYDLNKPNGQTSITDHGDIIWYRTHIKLDSSITDHVVLNINQRGASEVYLDGKLIHQFGKIHANPEKATYYNPRWDIHNFPAEVGKTYTLAIRFQNLQNRFPLYPVMNGYLRVSISSLENVNSPDIVENEYQAFYENWINNYYLALGAAIILLIINLSIFLVFPEEKASAYLSLSFVFFALYCIGIMYWFENTHDVFYLEIGYDVSIIIFTYFVLKAEYKILNQPEDVVFSFVSVIAVLAIGLMFVIQPELSGSMYAIIYMIAAFRIAWKSKLKNRVASFVFMGSSALSLSYWFLYALKTIGYDPFSVLGLMPYAFILNPLAISIYQGYAFGKRNKELRINLERVESLSREKETILSTQNEELERQVQERTSSLNDSLKRLKQAQSQLIHTEKMAYLGELTAGIAHEIKNPLNFVNNFAELSNELIDEALEELRAEEKSDAMIEALDILSDVKSNLSKIHSHGSRADRIVKSMLQHARGNEGALEPTRFNPFVEEYVHLSFHGMRAGQHPINVDIQLDLDTQIDEISLNSENFSRVIVNLCNNAFDAMKEKAHSDTTGEYEPLLTVSSKMLENSIELSIKDNGPGIPDKIKEKILQPFFTTKKGTEGTGLGLSITNDIVKAHGGSIAIDSSKTGTIFIVTIPLS